MHIHWHKIVHNTSSAHYKMCRCGHRKIALTSGGPMSAVDNDWVNREARGLVGHSDGPPIQPPPAPLILPLRQGGDAMVCMSWNEIRLVRKALWQLQKSSGIHDADRDLANDMRKRLEELRDAN